MVQPPEAVQVTLPPFSDARTYSVRPFPSTRTVPSPETLVALTVTEALDAPVVVADPPAAGATVVAGGLEVLLDEPHAAKSMEAPATATMGKAKARCRLVRNGEVIGPLKDGWERCSCIRPDDRRDCRVAAIPKGLAWLSGRRVQALGFHRSVDMALG